MTKLSMTYQEARDWILSRIDEKGNSNWQDRVEIQLNLSLLEVMSEYDWKTLRRKTTLTYNESAFCDACIELPEDCDRILVMLSTLDNMNPLIYNDSFEFAIAPTKYKTPNYPSIYTEYNLERDDTSESPNQVIEIWPEPSDGATFYLWYIEHIDELTDNDLAKVPLIHNSLWRLVIQHALIESLIANEHDRKVCEFEQQRYFIMLDKIKSREESGQDSPKQMELNIRNTSYMAGRKDKV